MLKNISALFLIVFLPCLLMAQENEWTAMNDGLNNRNAYCITVDPEDPDILYAGTEDGCYRSDNRGERWQRIYQGLPVRSIWVSPGGGTVLAAFSGGSRSDGIWISRNGGDFEVLTWILYPSTIAVDPENNDHIFCGTTERGIIYSLNGGDDWQQANDGLPSQSISHLAVKNLNDDTFLFTCTDRGTARALLEDDFNWEDATPHRLPTSQTAFSFEDDQGVWVGTNDESDSDGLYYSDNFGDDWEVARWAQYVRAVESAPELIVIACVETGVARSINGGEDWTEMNQELGSRNFTDLLIQVEDEATIIYHTSNSGVFAYTISRDENRPPVLAEIGDMEVNEDEELAFSLEAADPDGDDYSFSAENLPEGAELNGADFSWTPDYDQAGNYDVTFIVTDDGEGELTDEETVTITVVNVNRAPVLAAIGNREINEGEELAFSLEAADPDGDDYSFSAENLPEGAELNGADFSWTPDYDQAGNYDVTFIVTDEGEGELTDEEVVTISVIDASHVSWQGDRSIPTELLLHSAYPNPFNASTTIRFDLPHSSNVSITLTDLTGRRVATLLEDRLTAGRHRLTWDAKDYPAGVYLAQLKAGDQIRMTKVVLIR